MFGAWGSKAQVPGILNNQGRFTVSGNAFNGAAFFKFALITTNGATAVSLWSHNGTSVAGAEPSGAGVAVQVAAGLYSVNLGDVTVSNMTQEIPPAVFTNEAVYLRTWVNDGTNGWQKLSPEWRMTSSGYALVARTTLNPPASSTNFSGSLAGDVTGPQAVTVVSRVGGLGAAVVAAGASRANAATNASVGGTLVQRDASGNFSAGTVTGRFSGDGSGLTNLPLTVAAMPSGVMLVSATAQDSSLVTNGFRMVMSSPAAAWVSGSGSNAPMPRWGHSAVWSGQAMLVWGGNLGSGTFSAAGGVYSPDSDSWAQISTVGAPSARAGHTAVWSGTEMIVWGGSGVAGSYLGAGGRFAPDTQTWTALATNGAPTGRSGHVAVWIGAKMLVWGGINSSNMLNDGALYDPAANSWSALPLVNAPEARANAAAVWAGDRFIVWGGEGAFGELGTGGQLTFSNGLPVAWTALSTTNAPSPRSAHSAVWTGSRMIVWGGQAGSSPLGDGSSYNPQANVWQALNLTNAPAARSDHAAIWTGSDMVVTCGAGASGALATSAAYDPVSAQWRTLGTGGSPAARSVPGAVWSGTEIILFGGLNGVQPVAALQRLVPQSTWYFYRKL